MAVSAALTIPIDASTQGRRDAVAAAFGSALGTSGIAIDAVASKAMIRFAFPGDLDPLMNDLYRRGLTNSATVALSIGVVLARSGSVTQAEVLGVLGRVPTVSNAAFDGTTVTATVAAATISLQRLYDAIVSLGLEPVDSRSL